MADSQATKEEISNAEPADETDEKEEEIRITQEDLDRKQKILANRTKKRIYFGMKKSEIFKFKPTAVSEKSTLFGMSEYIQEVIKDDYTNVERIIDIPRDASGPDGRLQFQVETMKNFLIEVGLFVVYLSTQCNNNNCNKMQATSKFRYRCSAHRKPKDCNAIQYCVHTLDLFTERLNNKEYNVTNPNYPKQVKYKTKAIY